MTIVSEKNLKDMRLMGIELIKGCKGNSFKQLKSEYVQVDFESEDFIVYKLNLELG